MTVVGSAAEKWPNFFIVGAPRAGTTSLYRYLKEVPGVYMSPVKEPHYFAAALKASLSPDPARTFGPRPIYDRGEYLKLFQDVQDEVAVGEASPSYLAEREAARLIHEAVPEARIVISLRDPVERAYSHYLLHARYRPPELPPPEEFYKGPYIEAGLYAKQVKRYLDIFGAERVKILVFEEFIRDVEGTVNDLLRFLGVNRQAGGRIKRSYHGFLEPRAGPATRIILNRWVRFATRALIPFKLRRIGRELVLYKRGDKPKMPDAARKFLVEIYREDVRALEAILGRSLPWSFTGEGSGPPPA